MMYQSAFIRPLIAGFLLFSFGAVADELHLKDGSRIRGTVSSIKDGAVSIKTDFAGDLSIPLAKVDGIITEGEQTLTLKGGGVYTGRLGYADGKQTIQQKDGAEVVEIISVGELVPVPPPGAPAPSAVWKGQVELSVRGSEGNSDLLDASAGFTTTRQSIRDRLTLYLRGAYQETDSDRSRSEAIGGLRYERDLSPRTFAFTRLELEYDEFENIDLRSTLALGLGYFLVRSPRQELKVRGGLAYQHEEFGDGSSDDKPLAELGYDYHLDVRQWLRFNSTLTYFVDPGDVDDWRLTAENAADIPLSNTTGWKLRFGVRNEYDAQPLPDIERLDTFYYLSLVYAW